MDRRGGRRLVEDGQAEARRVTDVAVLDPHPWPAYVGQHRAELKATTTRAVDRAVAEGGGDWRALAGAPAQVHVDAAASIVEEPTAFERDVGHALVVGIGLQVGTLVRTNISEIMIRAAQPRFQKWSCDYHSWAVCPMEPPCRRAWCS